KLPVQSEITRITNAIAARKTPKLKLGTLEEMKAKIPQTFVQVMDEIAGLTRHLNPVELYTAADLRKAKSPFLHRAFYGTTDNPKFTYENALARVRATLKENDTPLEHIEERLHALKKTVLAEKISHKDEPARVARMVLLRKIDDDLATVDLAHGLEK